MYRTHPHPVASRSRKHILGRGKARLLSIGDKLYAGAMSLLLALVLFSVPANGIERRKPQFLKDSSYMILPLPYSLAGIGSGIVVTGLAGNFLDTNIDAFGLIITGDVTGSIVAVEDIHVIEEVLIFGISNQKIDKAYREQLRPTGHELVRKQLQIDRVGPGQWATG